LKEHWALNIIRRLRRFHYIPSIPIGARQMWNIIVGIVFIIGGLSGQLALRGTNSGPALAVLGGVLVIWGIVQVVKKNN
jgi:hypothetical protein